MLHSPLSQIHFIGQNYVSGTWICYFAEQLVMNRNALKYPRLLDSRFMFRPRGEEGSLVYWLAKAWARVVCFLMLRAVVVHPSKGKNGLIILISLGSRGNGTRFLVTLALTVFWLMAFRGSWKRIKASRCRFISRTWHVWYDNKARHFLLWLLWARGCLGWNYGWSDGWSQLCFWGSRTEGDRSH